MKRTATSGHWGVPGRLAVTLLTGALALSSAPEPALTAEGSPSPAEESNVVELLDTNGDLEEITNAASDQEDISVSDVGDLDSDTGDLPQESDADGEGATEVFGPAFMSDEYITLDDGTRVYAIDKDALPSYTDDKPLGYRGIDREVPSIHDANEDLTGVEDSLPASYDARSKGHVTAVKDQSPYGTSWAHATIAALESYAVTQLSYLCYDASIDLSERHLAYHTYVRHVTDPLGNTAGDYTQLSDDESFLDTGGNFYYSSLSLWNGYGAVDEADAPYQTLVDC